MIGDPGKKAFAITPNDNANLQQPAQGIWVGVDGDLTVVLQDDVNSVTFKNATGMMPILVKKVLATGTTATNLIGIQS